MDITQITDEQFDAWITCEKTVENPGARIVHDYQHSKKDYHLTSNTFPDIKFTLFYRRHREMEDDFSVGMYAVFPDGTKMVLIRFNGYSHKHPNHLDDECIVNRCHIHRAKARYTSAGYKTEAWAYETNEYNNVDGALAFAIKECNISGMACNSSPDGFSVTDDLFGPQ